MKINKVIDIVISVMSFLLTLLLLVFLKRIDILPLKYFLLITIIIFFINFIGILFICFKNKILKVIGYIVITLLIIFNCIACYYIKTTDNFLTKSFTNIINKYTSTFVVVTLNNDEIKDINDIKDKKIGYYKEIPNINSALNELNDYNIDKVEYSDLNKIMDDLTNNNIKFILLEENLYNLIFDLNKTLNKKDYKILYKFNLTFEEEIDSDENMEAFNIYIGGTDFTKQFYDFNMIVTINKKTNKILLTSIPRDYHINVYGKDASDNLGYHGIWGINTTIGSLEQLFNINIDYYLKINTNSLVELVDLLGGITYCSDETYTTTHSTILDSYDDSKGTKLYVKEGCKDYNGVQILTIARERMHVTGGDAKRQQNCQKILISIFNKVMTFDSLKNYNKLLDSVSNLYTTNVSKDIITSFIKDRLSNNTKWTINSQSVTGNGSKGYVHLSNYIDYITIPDMDSVTNATNKINQALQVK